MGSKTQDIKFGLWINISKNPRIKKLDFPGISLSVEIPKHLALTSVAMRILHVTQADLNKYPSDYLSLGGILHLELLGLPPPPKKVKGWTLRQVTGPLGTLVKLNYPPTNNSVQAVVPNQAVGGSNEAQPSNAPQTQSISNPTTDWSPLKVSLAFPTNILLREEVPTVAWWDTVC